MRLTPCGENIIVHLEPVDEKKVGSIYLPDKHSEMCRVGKIESVGPKVSVYKPGQEVVIGYWAGVAVEVPALGIFGELIRVVRESEVLAVLER